MSLMSLDSLHQRPVAYSGEGGIVRPRPRSDREFFDNFCTVFLSFVSRLNHTIRVPSRDAR